MTAEEAPRRRVLFVSRGNDARSPIAAAWLDIMAGNDFDSQSAGTEPASALDPDVQLVMQEVGVDMSAHLPRSVTGLRGDDYDIMIVLRPRGENDVPPLAGVPRVMYWSFAPLEDPERADRADRLGVARRMRDELRTRVGLLVNAIARGA